MGMMHYGLLFAGFSSIALGLFHIPRIWGTVFPHWSTEINGVSLLTRKLINTVLIALGFTLVILGSATLFLVVEKTEFSKFQVWFLFSCFIFWLWRMVWQIIYFPYRKLNPDLRLLSLHIFLILVFLVNAIAYLAPVIAIVV